MVNTLRQSKQSKPAGGMGGGGWVVTLKETVFH